MGFFTRNDGTDWRIPPNSPQHRSGDGQPASDRDDAPELHFCDNRANQFSCCADPVTPYA